MIKKMFITQYQFLKLKDEEKTNIYFHKNRNDFQGLSKQVTITDEDPHKNVRKAIKKANSGKYPPPTADSIVVEALKKDIKNFDKGAG